jgi:hypothetical protein
VLSGFERVKESRDAMRAITLDEGESEVFARAALALKYDDRQARAHHGIANPDAAPVRRPPPDLWSVFNRTQENLTKGGLHGRAPTDAASRPAPCRALIPMCA